MCFDVLRNPLASPFTIGISHGAAFGAAFAIIVLGAGELHRTGQGVIITNPYVIPFFAFFWSIDRCCCNFAVSKIKGFVTRSHDISWSGYGIFIFSSDNAHAVFC